MTSEMKICGDEPSSNPSATDCPAAHASDCALHNAPALPVGPCDFGAGLSDFDLGVAIGQAAHDANPVLGALLAEKTRRAEARDPSLLIARLRTEAALHERRSHEARDLAAEYADKAERVADRGLADNFRTRAYGYGITEDKQRREAASKRAQADALTSSQRAA